MAFLSNWIFWVIIAVIVFILALIGYLSDSRNKNKAVKTEQKTEDDNAKIEEVKNDAKQTNTAVVDDWSVMPGVDSLPVGETIKEPAVTVEPTVQPVGEVVEQPTVTVEPTVQPVGEVVEQPTVTVEPTVQPVSEVVEQQNGNMN